MKNSDVQNNVVCIVGPSGSGKSTVGYIVATLLGYRFVDVGKIWRIVGAKVLERGQDPTRALDCHRAAQELQRCAERLAPVVRPDCLVADKLITMMGCSMGQLVQPEVGMATAQSTKHEIILEIVADAVRTLYWPGGNIVVGRPFTYERVYPLAFLRVMLFAGEKLRAAVNLESETKADMVARDQLDGLAAITWEALNELDATYNMGRWATIDLARDIRGLVERRSPVPVPNQSALNAL